ncbi:MAG TPA: PIG-L family deacetylase [Thermomicrobiales bacterium]|nr:PIG-L family deacetylase [Thermomicrobiales bacterium]
MPTADERLGHPPVDLLWILAHPDDESFGSAGTMAWAADRGLRTAYVCATRGEAGQIRDSQLATPDTLGAVREHELRTAMSYVGLSELRLLGFRDSGMENTADNDDPRALIQQPPETILTHLVGHIRDLRPQTVITFGPEGVYGHPDHVMIGKLAARAVELAADPTWHPSLYEPWQTTALYFAAAPRERMLELANHPDSPLGEISEASRQNLGTPANAITHWLNVSSWLAIKRQLLAAHRTQVYDTPALNPDATEEELAGMTFESYARQPLPWDPTCEHEDAMDRARDEIGSATPPAGVLP